MRWIFWLLLAANLLMLVWHGLVKAPTERNAHQLSRGEFIRPHAPGSQVDDILLLSELDPAAVRVQESETPAVADPALCLMVGTFADIEEVRQFMARLAALDIESFEHPVDLSAGEGYWVYLDPLANREAARRRLTELQARGVDSYIIPKGELENGISLGVFTRRDLAEARLGELAKLGLAPRLQSIERSYRELWVMLGEAEEHKIAAAAWQALLQEYFPLQQRQNLCSDVASAKNFH